MMSDLFIVPKPQNMEVKEEKLVFDGIDLQADDPAILKFASALEKGSTRTVFAKDTSQQAEGYTISIREDGIYVGYGDQEGAFRACTTLYQIATQAQDGAIPCLEIRDWPAIKRRGFLLDMSRGKIPHLDVLKRFADILAGLKYNEFHLYLNRFGFQFKNFERYWKHLNAISAEEIRELDQYCRERFIRLVPNLNSFGHMETWSRTEEYKHLAITGKDGQPSPTLNPLLDETLDLVDSIYDGFFDNFSSDVVHLGMDETFDLGLNETREACEKYGVGRVYTDFLNKVLKLVVEKYHKTPMFWADIAFLHPEELVNIPDYSIVMDWGYETEYNYERNCRRLQELGLRYYVCPGTSLWNSFTGRSNNAVANMFNAAISAKSYGGEGFLLTEWGDRGYPQFFSLLSFPIAFGGAVAWNPEGDNSIDRSKIVALCKKYTDKYIYGIQEGPSLADLAYRMGNYYLLEKELYCNGTLCMKYAYRMHTMPEEDIPYMTRVIQYMEDCVEELKGIKADADVLAEMKLSCELVILFDKLICGYEVSQAEVEATKERFVKLWNRENKPYIENKLSQNESPFTGRIDMVYSDYLEKYGK